MSSFNCLTTAHYKPCSLNCSLACNPSQGHIITYDPTTGNEISSCGKKFCRWLDQQDNIFKSMKIDEELTSVKLKTINLPKPIIDESDMLSRQETPNCLMTAHMSNKKCAEDCLIY
jgi:hypothetical protein